MNLYIKSLLVTGLGYITYIHLADLFIAVKNIQSPVYRENPLELLVLLTIALSYIFVVETNKLQEAWTKKISNRRQKGLKK